MKAKGYDALMQRNQKNAAWLKANNSRKLVKAYLPYGRPEWENVWC